MSRRAAAVDTQGKTRFELRFDDDVFRRVEKLAEDVGVSVNQLMQGITRWALAAAHPGEFIGEDGYDPIDGTIDDTRPQAGCVWFGDTFPVFDLDFTERRVVREFKQPARKVAVARQRRSGKRRAS